jgi:hypothetical protein
MKMQQSSFLHRVRSIRLVAALDTSLSLVVQFAFVLKFETIPTLPCSEQITTTISKVVVGRSVESTNTNDIILSDLSDPDPDHYFQKYTFDPSKITRVYHLGRWRRYGRDNNMLLSVLHTIDMAINKHGKGDDEEGEVDGEFPAGMAISAWAAKTIHKFYFNTTNEYERALELE